MEKPTVLSGSIPSILLRRATQILAKDLSRMVSDLGLQARMREDYPGSNLFFQVTARALHLVLANVYAAEDFLMEERRLADRRQGRARAERKNILLHDLCQAGLFPGAGDIPLALPARPDASLAFVRRNGELRIAVADRAGRTIEVDTLSEALWRVLQETSAGENLAAAVFRLNGWTHWHWRGRPLEELRQEFFARWFDDAASDEALEGFWCKHAWEGNGARSLRGWLRTLLLGGRWPSQAREIGRSIIARGCLHLVEGKSVVCLQCDGPAGIGRSCPCRARAAEGWTPAVWTSYYVQQCDRVQRAEYYRCRSRRNDVEPRLLFRACIPSEARELTADVKMDFPDLDKGHPWNEDGQIIGGVFQPSRIWARARLRWQARDMKANQTGPIARLEIWRRSGHAVTKLGAVNLCVSGSAGQDGWIPLAVDGTLDRLFPQNRSLRRLGQQAFLPRLWNLCVACC